MPIYAEKGGLGFISDFRDFQKAILWITFSAKTIILGALLSSKRRSGTDLGAIGGPKRFKDHFASISEALSATTSMDLDDSPMHSALNFGKIFVYLSNKFTPTPYVKASCVQCSVP